MITSMFYRAIIALGLCALLFCTPRAVAQQGFAIGLAGGLHNALYDPLPIEFANDHFKTDVSGLGFSVGWVVAYQFTEGLSVEGLVAYTAYNAEGELSLPHSLVVNPSTGNVEELHTSLHNHITYATVGLEGAVKYSVPLDPNGGIRIGALVGAAVASVLNAEMEAYQQVDRPGDVRFNNPNNLPERDMGRQLVFFDGELTGRDDVRLSLTGGVFADIPLGSAITLVPTLFYNYGLTDIQGDDWKVDAVGGRVELLFWM